MSTKFFSAIAALLLFSGTAYANSYAGGIQFRQLDGDNNQYISEEEASQNQDLRARWEELDTNDDNRLDPVEFSAFEIEDETQQEMQDQNQQ